MPKLRLTDIRKSIALAIGTAVVSVTVLLFATLWYAGFPTIQHDDAIRPATLFDLIKLVFAIVAGIGGVAALVVAYRRQRITEHASQISEFAHLLAQAADARAEVSKMLAQAADERAKVETDRNGVRLFHERFAKASEQLGSDKAAIRLAGVYAMAGLADDWREGRQTCVDVLCAYMRMPYSPTAVEADEAQKLASYEEREVRNTVLRLVVLHLRHDAKSEASWQGLRMDFTGATFDGGDFSNVLFTSPTEVIFDRAKFVSGRIRFSNCTFATDVSFRGAVFSGASLDFLGSKFNSGVVSFRYAKFHEGSFQFGDRGGQLQEHGYVDSEPTLEGGELDFSYTRVQKASFYFGEPWGPHFTVMSGSVKFDSAELRGGTLWWFGALTGGDVSFDYTRFLGTTVDLTGVEFEGGRLFVSPGHYREQETEVLPQFTNFDKIPPGLVIPAYWDINEVVSPPTEDE
ncbi:pentapeptide repeat-containing protein [Micromonospora sp. NPDC049903]|uniref:pentapeptide repeat-containing protein n=1 Tax=Micromonospora sp. NPDC049903 TaxID=3364276 RepID=UPI00379EFFCB